MNIEEIIHDKEVLEEVLLNALSTMDRKDTVKETRIRLEELQNQCPHYSTKYNWEFRDGRCPYCGKKME